MGAAAADVSIDTFTQEAVEAVAQCQQRLMEVVYSPQGTQQTLWRLYLQVKSGGEKEGKGERGGGRGGGMNMRGKREEEKGVKGMMEVVYGTQVTQQTLWRLYFQVH